MNAEHQGPDELRGLIDGYVDAVASGRRTVGKLERLCVERHLRDLAESQDGTRDDIYFDEDAGMHVIQFAVRFVRHTKREWARKPFVFNERSAWMAFILWCVFGWMRWSPEDESWVRRFRSVYISVARKNGKTMLAAIVALYMLAFDAEAGAEVYFAATKRDQARIGWKQAAAIVKLDRDLRKEIKVIPSTSHMYLEDDSFCAALGRDSDTMDGPGAHLAVVDELHAHKDRGVWDVLESGQGSNLQPMMFGISTAGAKQEGLCWDLDHDAQRILERVVDDDSTFAFIARLDEKDDWSSEAAWYKANPNLGESVKVQKLRDNAIKAKNNPAYLNEFRRKHCNQWTTTITAWLALEKWDACRVDELPAFPPDTVCYVGVDIGSTNDFTAAVAVIPYEGRLYLRPMFWIAEESVGERERGDKKLRVPVRHWIEEGHIEATPGEVTDQDFTKQWLLNLRERFNVVEVAIDPYESRKFTTELEGLEFTAFYFFQRFNTLSPATKEMERSILQRKIAHDGNPVLRWMVHNVVVRMNAEGQVRPDKEKSADKIDGVLASIMGLGRAVIHEDDDGVAYYIPGVSA